MTMRSNVSTSRIVGGLRARRVPLLLATVGVLTGPVGLAAGQMAPGDHMGTWGWGVWGWGMALVGLLWMLLLVGVPLALAYWFLVRDRGQAGRDPAVETLREQYARGELDDDEFERRLERLT